MMSQESSSSTSLVDPPYAPPDSPGSSVSTRLQEEYDELLKYAVVVPTYDPRGMGGTLADARRMQDMDQATEDGIITVNARQQTSAGSVPDDEGQRTPRQEKDSPEVRHLPDFGGHSPIGVSLRDHTQSTSYGDRHAAKGKAEGFDFQPLFPESTRRGYTNTSGSDPPEERGATEYTRTQKIYTATIDPDVAQMETMLDQWCLELKRNVLAEFSNSKMRVVTNTSEEVRKETERFASEKVALVREMDGMKELLNTYEQTLERKDAVISNMTDALHRHRDKLELMRKFCDWKNMHNDAKREAFASNLARAHYERVLLRRVLAAWFSIIQSKWRQHVEKACQTKAQEVCLKLTADYEGKIASLNEALEALRREVQRLHVEREKYEEAMKKAFMRGVCALNMEAMTIFHDEAGNELKLSDRCDTNENYSSNMENGMPNKGDSLGKSIPHGAAFPTDTEEPQPPKVVTSQGSRSSQPHSQPRQSQARQSSSVSSVSSTTKVRSVGLRMTSKASDVHRQSGRSSSPVLNPPMASVVVERHQPVTKQTIGHATASKFPKQVSVENDKFKRLAGQGAPPKVHTVRVVD